MRILMVVIFFFSFACCAPQQSCPPITIWIHGTKLLFSKFFLKDFFYTKIGLHHASTFDLKYHSRAIAECLFKTDPQRFAFETFYFFGWNGKLSFKARAHAAKSLYDSIIHIRTEYIDRYGTPPFIRIITHSHGGNVLLEMARVATQESDLSIDEVILLACPIQQQTAPLIGNAFFCKIYSLFSILDSLQIADPQKVHYWWNYMTGEWDHFIESPFFSERMFPAQNKLIQIKVSVESIFHIPRGLTHIEFLLEPFLKNLSSILNQAEKQQKAQPFMSFELTSSEFKGLQTISS